MKKTIEAYKSLKTAQKNKMGNHYGFKGSNTNRTFDKWIRDEDEGRIRLLSLMMEDFFPKRGESTLSFNQDGEEVWFLLDKSSLSLFQVEKIIEVLSLSSRQERDFLDGRRFEVMVSQEEISQLIRI